MKQEVYKDGLHEIMRTGSLALAATYFEQVITDGDLEDKRKAIELAARITGAVAEVKANPLAGLQVVHITFANGGVTATVQAPEVLQMVEQVVPEPEPEPEPLVIDFQPTPAMLLGSGVNTDIREAA